MGQRAIAVNAIREVGANVVDTMAGLRATVADLNEGVLHPLGFTLYQVYNEADYVNSSLTLVQQNLIIGSLLAVTVLFLFLRTTSSTLVIGLAIPISIMGTFIMLWLLGRNLNVVSLAGMTFAAGMLVDNSIVVLENIYRHRQEGKPLFQAAYDGTVEVWGAILASTLTTIAVFVPIIFIEEQAGQLFRDIAIAISAGVGLSLVTSITVIPSLSARVLRTVAPGAKEESDRLRGERVARSALGRLAEMSRSRGWSSQRVGEFIYWLCGSTGWRLAVVVGFTSLAIGLSWAMVPQAEYLPKGNRNLIIAIVLPPPGYSIQELASLGSSIESVLRPHWEAEPGSVEEAALAWFAELGYALGQELFLCGSRPPGLYGRAGERWVARKGVVVALPSSHGRPPRRDQRHYTTGAVRARAGGGPKHRYRNLRPGAGNLDCPGGAGLWTGQGAHQWRPGPSHAKPGSGKP